MARIINSPGVQITEKDLSLRIETPAGTQVYVPGFAAQGPTSEPIMITSISEFESIYGTPTNAAERYMYYSCKEILNSPAVLNTIRLPYGSEGGSAYSNSYSGLFYPMLSSGNTWEIGAPVYKRLTNEQYQALTQNNFEWVNPTTTTSEVTSIVSSLSTVTYSAATSAAGLAFALANDVDGQNISISTLSGSQVTFTFNLTGYKTTLVATSNTMIQSVSGEVTVSAGFFVLNDLQTVVNEVAEGYYVGFADNSSVSVNSPDFDSIKTATTLSAVSGFAGLDTVRLDFALSAAKIDSDRGLASVSESLEKVGFIGFETDSYQDHLSLGVFKIRRSTADASKLTLATTEKFLGSFNANRKQVSPTGGILSNAYVEDIVNSGSSVIKMHINPNVSKNYNWAVNSTTPTSRLTVSEAAKGLFPIGVYAPDSLAAEETKQIGLVPRKLEKVLRLIENPETVTVDVLIDAGLSTIYSTTKYASPSAAGAFDDATYIPALSSVDSDGNSVVDNWRTVVNELINFSENTRKDCFTIVDPPRSVFVSGKSTKVINIEGNSFTVNIYNPLRQCVDSIETNYAATYANWVKNTDIFTGRQLWLPFSGYAAAVFGRSDAAANTWAAPAGFNRGEFNNALDLAFNPNQKQRDRLYEIATNPVVFFNGDGFVVFGQKTLQNKPTAFDRINIRRLFLTLERAVQKTVKYFVFEPNTVFTRKRLVDTISPIFNYAKNTEGLYDYLIVCDDRNNTPDTIDNNELIVDIYIKGTRTAEFILCNFIATRTGQNFQELI
jgi:phage tail sheath protein FI